MKTYFHNDVVNIFLQECGNLKEIDDSSIDVIIAGPPYNIGHKYISYSDKLDKETYLEKLNDFIDGSFRILKISGLLIVDIADFIFINGQVWLAAKYIVRQCLNSGFHFIGYHFYVIEGELFNNNMHSVYDENCFLPRNVNDHSPIQYILVFSKDGNFDLDSLNFRRSYSYQKLLNDAFWPDDLIDDFIKIFKLSHKKIVDPFMGIGNIGLRCIKLGSIYIGYDVEKEYIDRFIAKVKKL